SFLRASQRRHHLTQVAPPSYFKSHSRDAGSNLLFPLWRTCPHRARVLRSIKVRSKRSVAKCLSDLLIEPDVLLCWPKKRPACSTTITLAPSTFCSVSSTRVRVLPPRP